MTDNETVAKTFRALVQGAERKFARVRDVPAYGRIQNHHYFQKVFKAYMRLWKYQQEFRAKLVQSGLNRWEIGEIASRIGQLYFDQYMRTSEARFLVEAYVFYEAILNRRYFEGSKGTGKDLGVRSKELRFYARFLLVSLILNCTDMVKFLTERFKSLVDDSKGIFSTTDYKEWKLVVQEIDRFSRVHMAFMSVRPLRYCGTFDSHPASLPYVARFHAKKVLKLQNAVLSSYHRNEVKFAELTLDTYRMLQCLEWEPNGSSYQKHPDESNGNGTSIDHSGASGLIHMNLVVDMADPSLPSNPKKAILYRPSVTRMIAVMATICEELPPDSIMLIYLAAAAGKDSHSNGTHMESLEGSSSSSKSKTVSQNSREAYNTIPESRSNGKDSSVGLYDDYLWFGPKANEGLNILSPGYIIPFTRRPLFLIIDSGNSHAFKGLHGAKKGEATALLLSHLRPAFKNPSGVDMTQTGCQFTFFLTAPLPAFCEMVGLSSTDKEADVYKGAETIITTAFSEWEVILCTSTSLNLVWAQVISDPFLRRLILGFIFCRSVLSLFFPPQDSEEYLPVCLPGLPDSVSPKSGVVKSAVFRIAKHLGVADSFHFNDL